MNVLRARQQMGAVEVVFLGDEYSKGVQARQPAVEVKVAHILEVTPRPDRGLIQKLRWTFDPASDYPCGCGVGQEGMRRVLRELDQFDLIWFFKPRAADMFPNAVWPRSILDIAAEAPGLTVPIHVIPNGFDAPLDKPPRRPAAPPRIGFIGQFEYFPNGQGIRWFINGCWPHIKFAVPDARLRLIGPGSDGLLERHDPDVDVLGWVADPSEENPTVGLVGAFTMDGRRVMTSSPAFRNAQWKGPLNPTYLVPGSELCRTELLGNGGYVLGTMTSLLVRSDLIRKRPLFFNQPHLHADHEACFEVLKESDFGFCQQVLSYTRPRQESTSGFAEKFDVIILGKLALLLKYGKVFLDETERQQRFREIRGEYYRTLAHNVFRLRSESYWKYHKETLAAFGYEINSFLLVLAVLQDLIAQLFHPLNAVRRAGHWWSQAMKRLFNRPRMDTQRVP